MSNKKEWYKPITVKSAQELMNEFEKDQVVIVAIDKKYNKFHITTTGKTMSDIKEAGEAGNAIADCLGLNEKQIYEDRFNLIK